MGVAVITVAAMPLALVAALTPPAGASGAPAASSPGASASYVLTATSTSSSYAPTFTGNGYLGVRVPPTGQGYAAGAHPAESTLAGFYAQASGQVQQRANLPSWSTLTFTDGGQDFSLGAGPVTGWQQQLNLHSGVITTTATWKAPDGHVTGGPSSTQVSLQSGAAMPVTVGGATHTVPPGGTVTIPTRRPDLTATSDLARCQPATASSAQPGADPLAAADGSPATDWQPAQVASSLQVPLSRQATISSATVGWGQQWPPPPGPNEHPPPGPVQALRASSYDLVVSSDGHHWTTVATVSGRTTGTQDVLRFAPVQARYVGLRITAATGGTPPMLEELTVPAS